jgi:hypothetical protein
VVMPIPKEYQLLGLRIMFDTAMFMFFEAYMDSIIFNVTSCFLYAGLNYQSEATKFKNTSRCLYLNFLLSSSVDLYCSLLCCSIESYCYVYILSRAQKENSLLSSARNRQK